jgi:hypothetical protein
MNQRERTMTVVLMVVIFLMLAGFLGYQFIWSPIQDRNRQIANLREEIGEREKRASEIRDQLPRYEQLRKLSLPSDVDLARREYEMQLSGLLRRADFPASAITITPRPADVKTAPPLTGKKPAYTKLAFVVQVKGELASFVDFLDQFYRQPLLHQIKLLSVTRPNRSGDRKGTSNELDINMTVEAIVLDNAEPRLTLAPVPPAANLLGGGGAAFRVGMLAVESGRGGPVDLSRFLAANGGAGRKPVDYDLTLAEPGRQYASIAGKNVFYGPPPPPQVQPTVEQPKEPDLTPYIRLTSVSESEGFGRAHLFDFFNKQDYYIEQKPDGSVSVEIYWYVQDRRRPGGKGRDIEIGDAEGGNYVRLRVLKVRDGDLIVQVPEEEKEKKARTTAAAVGGSVLSGVNLGKIYRWHVGQVLKEMTPLRPSEVRQVFSPPAPERPPTGL